jgi:hypothetical protein
MIEAGANWEEVRYDLSGGSPRVMNPGRVTFFLPSFLAPPSLNIHLIISLLLYFILQRRDKELRQSDNRVL